MNLREGSDSIGATPARFLAGLTFVVALAGQMTFARIGLPNFVLLPERLFAVSALLVLFVPIYILVGTGRHLGATLRSGLPIFTLELIVLGSAMWATPSAGLHDAEIDLLCLMALIFLTGVGLALDTEAYTMMFMWCTAAAGCFYSAAGLAGGGVSTRISILGGGPNIFGRVCALGFIASLYLITRSRRSGLRWLLVPLPLAGAIVSGSRGAVLSLAVSLLIYGWNLVGADLAARVKRTGALSLICAGGLYFLWDRVAPIIQQRFITLTLQDRYDAGRTPLLAEAWHLFRDHPIFGTGLHGFEANYGFLVGFTYPHNIALQIAAETGLLGLGAFALVLIAVVRNLTPWKTLEKSAAAASACGILVLTASQFSGDYYDSRFAWMYLLIAITLVRTQRQRMSEEEVSQGKVARDLRAESLSHPAPTSVPLMRP